MASDHETMRIEREDETYLSFEPFLPLASEDLSAWPDGGGKGRKDSPRPPEDHYCVAEINRGPNGQPAVLCKVKKECRMA